MSIFSKTTVLENFKHYGFGLYKEDGKSPFREYHLDEQLMPKDANYLQGDWTITVTYNPRDSDMKKEKSKKEIRRDFRTVCLKRDKCTCVTCGVKATYSGEEDILFDVHHITDRSEMPNGGYVKENGITLCDECHWKAEAFHRTGVAISGFSPEELYQKIGSSKEKAVQASQELL